MVGSDSGGKPQPSSPAYVEFVGRVYDKATLAGYFREASLFFLPHRFDRSPHVLVEAMSAGLPLVASAQGGAIELIRNRGNGFLVDSGDIDGYSEAILELLRKPDVREAMGTRGQLLMRQAYTWPKIASKIEQNMRNVLGRAA